VLGNAGRHVAGVKSTSLVPPDLGTRLVGGRLSQVPRELADQVWLDLCARWV